MRKETDSEELGMLSGVVSQNATYGKVIALQVMPASFRSAPALHPNLFEYYPHHLFPKNQKANRVLSHCVANLVDVSHSSLIQRLRPSSFP